MKAKRLKLIRVTEGIYRTENGGVRVFHRPWQDKDCPWVMCWEDIFSARRETRFRTLKDVRAELNK